MGLKSESNASTTASRVRNNSVTYPCISSPCSAMVSTRRDKTSDNIRDVIGTRRALNINHEGLLSEMCILKLNVLLCGNYRLTLKQNSSKNTMQCFIELLRSENQYSLKLFKTKTGKKRFTWKSGVIFRRSASRSKIGRVRVKAATSVLKTEIWITIRNKKLKKTMKMLSSAGFIQR